ncbi:MAG: hypothetical protein HDR72_06055 [Ruminococcaceae bacterium]|nr:hypothetical protein [Oscillospiraceae bacterium]
MESIRLASHEQHLRLLDILEKRTRTIEIVQICDEDLDEPLIKAAAPYLIKKESVNEWHGTRRGGRGAPKFTVRANKEFFKHLRKYESFFRSMTDENRFEYVRETDFGLDDIAFLDSGGAVLFYTTTHEAYAYIAPELLKELDG